MDVNGRIADHVVVRVRWRRQVVRLFLGVLLGASGLAGLGPATPAGAAPAPLDAVLRASLSTLPAGGTVEAAVVLDRLPLALDVAAIRATGADAVPFTRLPMVRVRGTAVQIQAVAALAHVTSLWGNHGLELALHESVPLIQADAVWAPPLGYDGHGVGVAVLDSGIDGLHPDVSYPAHTKQNVKIVGDQHVYADQTLALEDVANTDTTTGHGTHVAGIVAGDGTASSGYYKGVAPGADLIGVGAADGVDMLTALAGYDWILANRTRYGIRVLNNSWADGTIEYSPDDPLNRASLAAAQAGITVVFAAGNDGHTGANVLNRYAWPSWVVAVGGGDKLGHLADYSSGGDDLHHPTVIAPGSYIASARASTGVATDANSSPLDLTDPSAPRMIDPTLTPYYTAALGTSMSAPHVAGVAALMLQANPMLTPADVKAILGSTATPVTGCAVANCGSGYVNALAAVQASLARRNAAPVAALSASPASGAAPLVVTLDASASSDPDGTVAGYRWDFEGDGSVDAVTATPTVTHTYAAGAFAATVTAVDDAGLASVPVSAEVRSSMPPTAEATAPAKGKAGAAVTFDASASSDPDGRIVSYRFTFGDGSTATSTTPVVTHTYVAARAQVFPWSVTVTDDAGVSDALAASIKITP
jgi:serine protease AprX